VALLLDLVLEHAAGDVGPVRDGEDAHEATLDQRLWTARHRIVTFTVPGTVKVVRPAVRIPKLTPSEGLRNEEDLGAILVQIAREIRARRPPAGMVTRIPAIDGLGGSGKSSFALQQLS
jgi:hypothetical protein